jgi:hypothetical protein
MHRLGCALALSVLLGGCSIGRDCPGDDCIELPPLPDAGLPDATVTTRDAACAVQSARAMRASTRPLDLVFVIDNSGSMTEEIAAIRRNINQNFAALIQESGADYRVVVISRFGSDGTAVCIEPPLAGAECSAGLYENDSPVFFHYNAEIGSTDAFCLILSTFDRPDPELRAPEGWQSFLRPEALKAFIVITDDSPGCMYEEGELSVQFGGLDVDPYAEALAFHQALLQKAPEQFGVPPDVRYLFYSFVGMRPNDPESEPWFPHQAVQPTTCDTAAGPGVSYQALSIITDALRYPVCEGRGFDAVFRVLAHSVVEAVKADCAFELPEPPPGQSIMRSTIAIEYRPGGQGEAVQLSQVHDASECGAQSFLVRDDQLELCPEACTAVEADPNAQLDVLYSCLVVPE